MARALQLASYGGSRVSPNPFVGAVIVARGRIIGEGYHRIYGQAHAEVNAVRSVAAADRELLREATMYVSLEPCSHFGKTPPCADLIIREGIPRVEVAVEDPFLKDYESGIEKMRRAGVEVGVGMMRREALEINRRFFTAHTLRRPYVLLKWAQSADGFIAGRGGTPVMFSTPYTSLLMHRERAFCDAIMAGTGTVVCDNPRLDCRLWPTRDPRHRPLKVTFESPRYPADSLLARAGAVTMDRGEALADFLHRLYADHGVTSLMVEGGATTLGLFARERLFDEVRVEISPVALGDGVRTPEILPGQTPGLAAELMTGGSCADVFGEGFRQLPTQRYDGNVILSFVKNY